MNVVKDLEKIGFCERCGGLRDEDGCLVCAAMRSCALRTVNFLLNDGAKRVTWVGDVDEQLGRWFCSHLKSQYGVRVEAENSLRVYRAYRGEVETQFHAHRLGRHCLARRWSDCKPNARAPRSLARCAAWYALLGLLFGVLVFAICSGVPLEVF